MSCRGNAIEWAELISYCMLPPCLCKDMEVFTWLIKIYAVNFERISATMPHEPPNGSSVGKSTLPGINVENLQEV